MIEKFNTFNNYHFQNFSLSGSTRKMYFYKLDLKFDISILNCTNKDYDPNKLDR